MIAPQMSKIKTRGSSALYRVRRADLPSHSYIVSSPHSKRIHFNPHITDFDLYRLSVRANEALLRAAQRVGILDGARVKDVCEVILLSGGFYYHLNRAFYNVFRHSLPTGFLGVRRAFLATKPLAHVSYSNLEAVPPRNITFIGDTIATGATLRYAIPYYVQRAPRIQKLVIFTLAGALPGARQLARLERTILKKHGIKLYVFFAEAIFGLADNQTDMHYFHKDTIAPKASLDAARRALGLELGAKMCVVWDWGQRNKDPVRHLREVIVASRQWGKPASHITQKALVALKRRERSLKAKGL